MIKLSDYVMKYLEEKEITQAFMLPGGGAMHLVDSLGNSNIDYVCFQHEQGAAIASEAYGQHTNKPCLLLVTSGPGATNAITGVTAGWIDSTPMFVISGQSKRADLVGNKKVRQIGSQEVQIIPMVEPITKYAVQIEEPAEIRYHLERAYHEATMGRPGPVWLSIPLDVQGAMIEETALEGYEEKENIPKDIHIEVGKAVKMLLESKKPLIIAGNGIKLAGGEDTLKSIVERYKIPILTTWKTIDMFAEDDEVYVGHPGIMGDRGANKILQEADLLLSIGSRLDTSITAFDDSHFAYNAKKIIVDIDINEINRMEMEKEVCLVCDAKYFLKELLKELSKVEENFNDNREIYSSWLRSCKELRKKYPTVTERHKDTDNYVSAYYFIDELCKHLCEGDIIVPESSGGAGEITYQAWKLKYGQKIKNAAGLGSMGFGLPYAIGSCIANKGQRTILINGDGAFQLNIQELETLRRLNLPVKIFIWDNQGYASIRTMQANTFDGRFVACNADSGYTTPDIQKVATAYGFPTYLLENNSAVDLHLASILDLPNSCVCIVKVLPDEPVSPRVKSLLKPDGTLVSGTLENMWPYLTDTEE